MSSISRYLSSANISIATRAIWPASSRLSSQSPSTVKTIRELRPNTKTREERRLKKRCSTRDRAVSKTQSSMIRSRKWTAKILTRKSPRIQTTNSSRTSRNEATLSASSTERSRGSSGTWWLSRARERGFLWSESWSVSRRIYSTEERTKLWL